MMGSASGEKDGIRGAPHGGPLRKPRIPYYEGDSRDEIFPRVWGGDRPHGDRSVDMLVRRLRRKVDESSGRYTYVQTEHKFGYRLEAVPKEFPRRHRSRREDPMARTRCTASTETSSRR